jgi:protein-S-isoprenylcysteine O-methyltransferase Ste14
MARSRLPSLGPHGEGWVAIQSVLLVILVMSGTLGPAVDGPARVVLVAAGYVLIAMGLGLGLAGIAQQRRQFTTMPKPKAGARLLEDGPYRLVRHPMYGGLILAGFGWAMASASPMTLLIAFVILGFFTLKSYREEAWLEERFSDYPAYRSRTKRFIPGVY